MKKKIKKREEFARQLKAKEKSDKEISEMFKIADTDSLQNVIGEPESTDKVKAKVTEDTDFNLDNFCFAMPNTSPLPSTRARTASKPTTDTSSSGFVFPKIPIRFGRRSLNPKIMTAAVHISVKYEISFSTVIKAGCDWANFVFGQEWTVGPDFGEEDEHSEVEDEEIDVEVDIDPEPPIKKTRKVLKDLTFRFPSRQTLSLWLKDAAILNLKYLGEVLQIKGDGLVATWGTDDTVKKAGHWFFDAKTNHITLRGRTTPEKHSPQDLTQIFLTLEKIQHLA